MRKEILRTPVALNLGSEPASHPLNLGIEFIIVRMSNSVHSIKIDKGENRENVRFVKGVARKRTNLP